MVEYGSPSFRGLARDLEILGRRGALTTKNVIEYYCFDRVSDYVELVFRQENFEQQLEFLSEWSEDPATKIGRIRHYLTELFQTAAGGSTSWSRALQLIESEGRTSLSVAFARNVSKLRAEPRAFARRLLEIWVAEPLADKACLFRKASEFDELLGGSRLEIHWADASSTLTPWREKQTRTRQLLADEKTMKRASAAPANTLNHYLEGSEARKLWDSASFMIQAYGVVLNAWISIVHEKLNLRRPKRPGEVVTDFTRELRMLVDEPAGSPGYPTRLHWLYVHRHDVRDGLVTELVAYIPNTNKDVEEWTRRQFFGKRVIGPLPQNAIKFRRYQKSAERSFSRHLTLIRGLCAAVEPHSSKNRIFMTRAGIDLRRMHWTLGPKKTAQRIGVSRLLDDGARQVADEDLSILSSFDDISLPFGSCWEFAEHKYRKVVAAQRREIQDENAPQNRNAGRLRESA